MALGNKSGAPASVTGVLSLNMARGELWGLGAGLGAGPSGQAGV